LIGIVAAGYLGIVEPRAGRGGQGGPHAVFLSRSDQGGAGVLHARLGRAAVAVLRATERLADSEAYPDAATARRETRKARAWLADLGAGGPEVALLAAILDALERLGGLGPAPALAALASYATFLATESDPDEAADVLDTIVGVAAGPNPAARIRIEMLVAERRAELGDREDALRAIARAERLARRLGDRALVWECRLAAAQRLREGGQSEAARLGARRLRAAATRAGEREFVARAEIELAWAWEEDSRFFQALRHAVAAFTAWRHGDTGVTALLKVGWLLARLGEAGTATRAFDEVLRWEHSGKARYSALLGLVRCAMVRDDRAAFERRRRGIEALIAEMPAALLPDVYYHLALGHGAFGNRRAALDMAGQALALAREQDDDLEARIAEFLSDPVSPWPMSEAPSVATHRLAQGVERLLGG